MSRHDRIADPWGPRTPIRRGEAWPARVDSYLEPGAEPEAWVQTASILHSDGDAYDLAVQGGRIVGVRGRAVDRVNRGRLGPKDLFGWQATHSPDRLARPLVRRDGELREASWDEAMELVAERTRALLRERGPSSIGFYTSGQLFLEEYYTLAVIARAGIGTNHLDGNTRLCTATAGESLKESFGCDGQPASYDDVGHCDALALFGHNVAETQPVLWARMLDRLEGPDPPALVVVDPRRTVSAARATVRVPLRPGTNLAFMNALLHEVVANGWVDEAYVAAHAVGLDELRKTVEPCTPEWAAPICGVDAGVIRAAAEVVGTAERLLCTVLQGFYQAHQATAAACQVNNLVILRGTLGRPGCGVLQMNGQPTAQNTRETGANGDLPGFRNWANPAHVADLARVWNVEPDHIPHDGPPTHVMEMVRLMEEGEIGFFWISATNPLVSLPEARRIREVLARDEVFVVVQDLFLTETAAVADIVLPAATQGRRRAPSRTPTARSTSRSRRSTRRGRGAPTSTSGSTTRAGWASATATASRWSSGTTPSRRSRRSRAASPTARAATPTSPTTRCATARGSSGAASGSTPAGGSSPTRTCARRSAGTSSPARSWGRTPTARATPRARRCCGRARTCRRTSCPATTTRCGSTPGGRSSTSTRARRPPARRSSTPRRPTSGSRSRPRTRRTSASPRATSPTSSPRAGGCAPACG
jgi:anaerobic selenocysteine-containing dehydrogenase